MDPYPPWLHALLSICGVFSTMVTPLAIIVWMVLRRVRDPKAAIRPGAMRLLAWFVIAFGGFFLLAFASGGHKASPEVQAAAIVWFVVLTAICARMLWTLYRRIGLPRG
jgi:hypothetical protein